MSAGPRKFSPSEPSSRMTATPSFPTPSFTRLVPVLPAGPWSSCCFFRFARPKIRPPANIKSSFTRIRFHPVRDGFLLHVNVSRFKKWHEIRKDVLRPQIRGSFHRTYRDNRHCNPE